MLNPQLKVTKLNLKNFIVLNSNLKLKLRQCEALFRQARGAKRRSATQAGLVILAPQYGAKHLNRVRSTKSGAKHLNWCEAPKLGRRPISTV